MKLYISVQLHDGPGTDSPTLNSRSTTIASVTIVTTTFQCFVITAQHGKPSDQHMNYSAVNLTPDENIILYDNLTFNGRYLYFNTPDDKLKLWQIRSLQSAINITTDRLIYNGKSNPTCNYAGISMYDYNDDSFSETTSLCVKSSDTQYGQPDQLDFYQAPILSSKTDWVRLVVHAYKEYSLFKVSLRISSTKCKLVIVNVCENMHDVMLGNPGIFNISSDAKSLVLGLPMPCFVVLFKYDMEMNVLYKPSCTSQMRVKETTDRNKVLKYQLAGFFKGRCLSFLLPYQINRFQFTHFGQFATL